SPSTSPSVTPSTPPGSAANPGGTVTTGGNPSGPLYVAIGDSYSSGAGSDRTPTNPTVDTSSYFTSTVYGTNQCFRNKNAAQYLLASNLGYALTDVSCGGANSTNVLSAGQFGEPPQDKYVYSDIQLVTMTMTGNDAGLMWLLQACIMNQLGNVNDCSGNDPTYLAAAANMKSVIINNVPSEINNILTSITSKSKVAKVRWAGYPYILPGPGRPNETCAFLSSGEQKVWDDMQLLENNTIKSNVEAFAKSSGRDIKYVDPLATDSPFMQLDNGHSRDACSTSLNRAINGPNDNPSAGGYHPNILGQQYYYQLYKASL
ncbi:MAG: hypothetical protein JWO07_704, partial [Candidatus Saccharibacteria bacterium]|nr:hypothetical protein [Candidatus Saccharibacteria bacterium]